MAKVGRPKKIIEPDIQEFLKLARTFTRQLEIIASYSDIDETDKELYKIALQNVEEKLKDIKEREKL